MSDDPLASLVARSFGGDVSNVRAEELTPDGTVERKRLHFTRDSRTTTALFERSAPGPPTEAQLLPFLARKTEHVPRVYSRGIPPQHVSLGPWLLLEDVAEGPSACDGDGVAIVRAKLSIERAVAGDGPALRALGVPSHTAGELVARAAPRIADERRVITAAVAAERLSSWPVGLVHGDLRCARAVRMERGVIITAWRDAYLGYALLDLARLCADLRAHGQGSSADSAAAVYLAEATGADGAERLRDAETVDALLREASAAYN